MGAERITAAFRAAHKIAQIKALQGIARTSGRVLAAPFRGAGRIGREAGRIGRTYMAGRRLGLSSPRAMGEAIRRYFIRASRRLARAPIIQIVREIINIIGDIRTHYHERKAEGAPRDLAMYDAIRRATRGVRVGIILPEELREFSQMLSNLLLGSRRGIIGTIRDVAETGLRAAGVKIPRRGFRTCPTCGNNRVAASATACPTCGHVF
jgi:hypothetical protein